MAENITPRQILKDLLQGSAPPRPLFVPIVFALGARVENLPLRAFLANPTKISNSLRQIHSRLRSDGVSCYFDALLEAEALGGTLEWPSDQEPPVLRWPDSSERGRLLAGLRSPEEILKSGRVPVALEVIRRLKALLRDDSLLMAGVSGPFTLASRLTGLHGTNPPTCGGMPDSALEVATSAITNVAKAFAEAGASLIFLCEDTLPALRAGGSEDWTSMLAPIFNIIRFYEALPILQIANADAVAENADMILQLAQGCIVCAAPEAMRNLPPERRPSTLAISLPAVAFRQDQPGEPNFDPALRQLISDLRPAIVTTADDVPAATDLKRLAAISDVLRR
jgi:Uroporphyrinogen decarboxylase (URO-D)